MVLPCHNKAQSQQAPPLWNLVNGRLPLRLHALLCASLHCSHSNSYLVYHHPSFYLGEGQGPDPKDGHWGPLPIKQPTPLV